MIAAAILVEYMDPPSDDQQFVKVEFSIYRLRTST